VSTEAIKSPVKDAAPSHAERRAEPRYKFTAAAELIANTSKDRSQGRVNVISQQGCYVETNSCLPLGTDLAIRITREGKSFEAQAKVVFNQTSKGMGLLFGTIEPTQLPILEAWIGASRETSWLAANRRRSQRILMQVGVRVSTPGGSGRGFEEESKTLAISAHGALLSLSQPVTKGQRVILSNIRTQSAVECIVVHIGDSQDSRQEVGVAFTMSNLTFWHVNFPPSDWTSRHADAEQPLGHPGKG